MALLYRKQVRDAALVFMADEANGFNQTLEALEIPYGLQTSQLFEIDWSKNSLNFAQTFVEPDDIEASEIIEFPGALMYTTEAEDIGEPRGIPYFGNLILAIDFYVRFRTGAEKNLEDLSDAVEAAGMTVLNRQSNAWPPGVLFSRKSKSSKQKVRPLSDGYQQLVRIEAQFGTTSISIT